MSQDLVLEMGALPWKPSAEATDRLLLNFHDVPIAGIIEQDQTLFLYQRVLDLGDGWDVWTYCNVPSIDPFVDADPEFLRGILDMALRSHGSILVLANGGHIQATRMLEASANDEDLIKDIVRSLRAGIAEQTEALSSVAALVGV